MWGHHPTVGPQHSAVDGHGAAGGGPRLNPLHQGAPQAADLRRQLLGDRLETALSGAPHREAPVHDQQRSQRHHLVGRLIEHRQPNGMDECQ